MNLCVRCIDFVSSYTIFFLDFEDDPIVWFSIYSTCALGFKVSSGTKTCPQEELLDTVQPKVHHCKPFHDFFSVKFNVGKIDTKSIVFKGNEFSLTFILTSTNMDDDYLLDNDLWVLSSIFNNIPVLLRWS